MKKSDIMAFNRARMLHHSRVAASRPIALLALALLACASPARAQERQPVERIACGGYDIVPSGFRRPNEPSRLNIS